MSILYTVCPGGRSLSPGVLGRLHWGCMDSPRRRSSRAWNLQNLQSTWLLATGPWNCLLATGCSRTCLMCLMICDRGTSGQRQFFNELAPTPIQSVSCDVCLCACAFVPSAGTWKHVVWRLLVKEHIAKISKPMKMWTSLRTTSFFW